MAVKIRKQKVQKKNCYKNSLEATPFGNKINHLEKMKLMWIVIKFIKKNKLTSKTHQRLRSEKDNVFLKKLIA